jgi:hypothetical protein
LTFPGVFFVELISWVCQESINRSSGTVLSELFLSTGQPCGHGPERLLGVPAVAVPVPVPLWLLQHDAPGVCWMGGGGASSASHL